MLFDFLKRNTFSYPVNGQYMNKIRKQFLLLSILESNATHHYFSTSNTEKDRTPSAPATARNLFSQVNKNSNVILSYCTKWHIFIAYNFIFFNTFYSSYMRQLLKFRLTGFLPLSVSYLKKDFISLD